MTVAHIKLARLYVNDLVAFACQLNDEIRDKRAAEINDSTDANDHDELHTENEANHDANYLIVDAHSMIIMRALDTLEAETA